LKTKKIRKLFGKFIMQFDECFVQLNLYRFANRRSINLTKQYLSSPSRTPLTLPPAAPNTKETSLPPPPPPNKQSPMVASLLKAWLTTARVRLARANEESRGKEIKRKEIDVVKI
jgi:hypothetical protein